MLCNEGMFVVKCNYLLLCKEVFDEKGNVNRFVSDSWDDLDDYESLNNPAVKLVKTENFT